MLESESKQTPVKASQANANKVRTRSFFRITALEMTILLVGGLILLVTVAPLFLRANIQTNEEQAAALMQDLAYAEAAFFAENGHYGSLNDLVKADPPYVDPIMREDRNYGYRFAVTVDGMEQWHARAIPALRRITGMRSFYIDEQGHLESID